MSLVLLIPSSYAAVVFHVLSDAGARNEPPLNMGLATS